MPAPQSSVINKALTQALLAKGFYNNSYDSQGNLVQDKTSLPPGLAKLVLGLSTGDGAWFQTWQSQQVVVIPVTSPPGSESAAPPGIGLP
jgi:hypothetical protein